MYLYMVIVMTSKGLVIYKEAPPLLHTSLISSRPVRPLRPKKHSDPVLTFVHCHVGSVLADPHLPRTSAITNHTRQRTLALTWRFQKETGDHRTISQRQDYTLSDVASKEAPPPLRFESHFTHVNDWLLPIQFSLSANNHCLSSSVRESCISLRVVTSVTLYKCSQRTIRVSPN